MTYRAADHCVLAYLGRIGVARTARRAVLPWSVDAKTGQASVSPLPLSGGHIRTCRRFLLIKSNFGLSVFRLIVKKHRTSDNRGEPLTSVADTP